MEENYRHNFIHSDLYPPILKNLPSKSLIKFLIVSKSWYSLIKSPNFIALHSNHHKSLFHNHRHLFLLKSCSSFYLFRHGNHHCTRLHSPAKDFKSIAATCDNLICLSNRKNNRLLLWNPSINRFKEIKFSLLFKVCKYTVGLGRNPLDHNNGYKIVIISYCNRSMRFRGESPPYAQVYSLNYAISGWKNVSVPQLDDRVSSISRACSGNGFIHWIVFYSDYEPVEDEDSVDGFSFKEYGVSILRFDLRNDAFDELQLPTPLLYKRKAFLDLAVLDNSIAVISNIGGKERTVWKMGKYGAEEDQCYWEQLYRIKIGYMTSLSETVWKKEDGKVFITTASGGVIVFYVKTQNSGFFEGFIGMIGDEAFGLIDSLALLDD